ncbi:MAG: threonine-phosphate decarboxylase CobD [Cellulosilyticaceae bacterium]
MKTRGHGGDIYGFRCNENGKSQDILDFSANINPLGISQRMREVLANAIEKCTAYPDPQCRALREAIGRFEDVPKAWVIPGNGAADVIFRFVYATKPKKAMVLAPTFSEYEEALRAVGAEVVYYPLHEKDDFQVTASILDAIEESLDVVFICNPNNPTGQVVDKELLNDILVKCEKVHVNLVVDECFNDFLEMADEYTVKELLPQSERLFILKAFTKMYGIPGVRIGYGITSNEKLLNAIEASGQAWSVSVLAQEAGICATTEQDYVVATKKLIAEEKDYLVQGLEALGMQVYKPYANYIFFKNPYPIVLEKALEKEGIMIRSCSNYHGLDATFYRIAIKEHQANKKLMTCLQEILKAYDRKEKR